MRPELTAFLLRGGRVPVTSLVGAFLLVVLAGLLIVVAVVVGLLAVYLWLRAPLGAAPAALAAAGTALAAAVAALVAARAIQSGVRAPDAAQIGSDLVRQHPFESAAAAFAAGLAVGGSADVRRALASALSSPRG